MPRKNPAAVALGKRNKGVPKKLSEEERERRRKAFEKAKSKRWQKK